MVDAARRSHPHLADDEWPNTVRRHLDEDVIGAIIADIIKVDESTGGRGVRTVPSEQIAMARLTDLRNGGFTTQPFPVAFKFLAAGRSERAIAHKVGMSKSQVHRLMSGELKPTPEEMRDIAVALNRSPLYFHEMRVHMIIAEVARWLESQPERTIHMAKKMTA